MKHILRVIRSHGFWSLIISLLALCLAMMRFVFYNANFVPGRILSEICFIVLVLHIINRDESPEFKMIWLVILLVLHMPAMLLYILFTSCRSNKKFFIKYDAVASEIKKVCQHIAGKTPFPPPITPVAANQLHYLTSATHYPVSYGGNAEYYPLGECFQAALLASLEQAERSIFMEYFTIEEGVMWDAIHKILRQKAKEGVIVCMMFDDLGCLPTLPEHYDRLLESEGIHAVCTNRVPLIVLSRLNNNRDHRKITVIDGKVGFTGGINLADEYINEIQVYGHWKDTALKLEGDCVKNLTAIFLTMWNTQSTFQLDPQKYILPCEGAEETDRGIYFPYGSGPQPLYNESVGKNVYINMINAAQDYCYITTPYLICDNELLSCLRLAAKKGVDVRLIVPHIPDKKIIFWMTRSNYRPLLEDGVKIYEYTPGFIHAKTIVCDDLFAACGTINMDYRSFDHHFENAVWMYDTPCIAAMKNDFLSTIMVSEPETLDSAKTPSIEKVCASTIKLFAPLL